MTQTTAVWRLSSPRAALDWIRNSLMEMTELGPHPPSIDFNTPLTTKMIEFLGDSAELQGVALNVPRFDLEEGESVRALIRQIDTDERY